VQNRLRRFDDMSTSATSGNQDIDGAGFSQLAKSRQWKFDAHLLVEIRDPMRRLGLDPARIGAFLIMLPHHKRDIALDRREGRDRGSQLAFFVRLAHLLVQQIRHLPGPLPRQQSTDVRQRMKREIRRGSGNPDGGDRSARFDLAGQQIPEAGRTLELALRRGKNVLVEETLIGQRTAELQLVFVDRRRRQRMRQDRAPEGRQKALELDADNRGRPQQAA
jgi:hypothetical protein